MVQVPNKKGMSMPWFGWHFMSNELDPRPVQGPVEVPGSTTRPQDNRVHAYTPGQCEVESQTLVCIPMLHLHMGMSVNSRRQLIARPRGLQNTSN